MYNYEIVFDNDWAKPVFIDGDDSSQDNNWFKIFDNQILVFAAPYNRILCVICRVKNSVPV